MFHVNLGEAEKVCGGRWWWVGVSDKTEITRRRCRRLRWNHAVGDSLIIGGWHTLEIWYINDVAVNFGSFNQLLYRLTKYIFWAQRISFISFRFHQKLLLILAINWPSLKWINASKRRIYHVSFSKNVYTTKKRVWIKMIYRVFEANRYVFTWSWSWSL